MEEGPFDSKLGAAILAVSAVSLLHFVWVVSCSIFLHICCSEQDALRKYADFSQQIQAGQPNGQTFEQWEAAIEKVSCFSTVINGCLISWSSKDGPWTELCARSVVLCSLSQPQVVSMMSLSV